MLEVLGVLLLMFLLFVLALVWLGFKVARRVIGVFQGTAAFFTPSMAGFNGVPDPRWSRLSALLDRRQREQARVARERIRAFLAERNSAALTPHEAQLMISCEKRVPELLDTCLERCRTARTDERCDYAAPTLERLVRIGEEAEAARRAIRERDDQQLTTMHHYFDAVATREPR
ncbi:hypothetical protein GCM10022280_00900 [Sphingomonas swuensis]|uniref:Uncharacterized protein n=1 Tax=Sphingomonas swuensis TaxID=977800 RepID=A0ABP7S8Z8_9SPHN